MLVVWKWGKETAKVQHVLAATTGARLSSRYREHDHVPALDRTGPNPLRNPLCRSYLNKLCLSASILINSRFPFWLILLWVIKIWAKISSSAVSSSCLERSTLRSPDQGIYRNANHVLSFLCREPVLIYKNRRRLSRSSENVMKPRDANVQQASQRNRKGSSLLKSNTR
jgi:hypothetical protein